MGKGRLSVRARGFTAALAAALATGMLAAAASSADPVTGGTTKLAFDQTTGEGFADMGIGISTTGAAKDGKHGFSFPIKGGDLVKGPKGEIDHKGGLAFFSEGDTGVGSVKFTQFIVKLGKDSSKAKVFAKSDHAAVRLMDLDLSNATIGGSVGVNLKIKGADATLGKQGAAVLSDTFAFPFDKGIPLGAVTIKASLTS